EPAGGRLRRAAGEAGGRWARRGGGRCGDGLTGRSRDGAGRPATLAGAAVGPDAGGPPLPASPRERGEGPRRLVLPAPPRLGPARPLPRLRGRVGVGATGAIAPTRDPPPHATSSPGHPPAIPCPTGPEPTFRHHRPPRYP